MKINNRAGCIVIAAMATACLLVAIDVRAQSKPPAPATIRGISKPSAIVDKLSFMTPAPIREVKVKEGDRVKKGQVLIAQDDRIEANQFQQLKLEADSTVRVDVYIKGMGVKKARLKIVEDLKKTDNVSQMELDKAILEVAEAEAQVEVAKLDNQGKKLEAARQGIKVEQMKMNSPIDGVVTSLNIREGETAMPNAKDPVIVVVQNDPLYCEFQVPTQQSSRLKVGDKLEVRHEIDKEDAWAGGTVKFINPFANAGSNTQTVRIELPNPNNRDSGMQVYLKLPDSIANPAVAEAPQSR